MAITILNIIGAIASFGAMLYVNLVCMPRFTQFMTTIGGQLPGVTLMGISVSIFIQMNLFFIVLFLSAIILASMRWKRDLIKYTAPVLSLASSLLICLALVAIMTPILALQKALQP